MLQLSGQVLSLQEIASFAAGAFAVELAAAAIARMEASRRVVQAAAEHHIPAYGINTGFGKMCEVRIPDDAIERLQLNLVRSHACGMGRPLSEEETRVMMALRANTLALGFSGVRPLVAQTLAAMLNHGVHPVIPEKGSVGASGDLAPLAHLALSLVGEGEVFFQGQRMSSAGALRRAELTPLQLEAKEGLALLNGTQAMHAVGGLALLRAQRLARVADVAGAMSLEALKGSPVAFD